MEQQQDNQNSNISTEKDETVLDDFEPWSKGPWMIALTENPKVIEEIKKDMVEATDKVALILLDGNKPRNIVGYIAATPETITEDICNANLIADAPDFFNAASQAFYALQLLDHEKIKPILPEICDAEGLEIIQNLRKRLFDILRIAEPNIFNVDNPDVAKKEITDAVDAEDKTISVEKSV